LLKIKKRDLKTENILLDSNFNAKISDFGITKIKNENKIHDTIGLFGTPIYQSPEQFQEDMDVKVGVYSDVYAFGNLLYELLTETVPWVSEDVNDLETLKYLVVNMKNRPKIFNLEKYLKNETQKFIIEIIHQCWEHNPNDRPSFIQIKGFFENKKIFKKF
jgi:serine/threonine protein kinase